MERITGKKVTVGLLFVILLVSLFFSAGVFAADVQVNGDATVGNIVETDAATTTATSVMGVDYRGHIQDIGNYPKNEAVWVHGPDQLGTTGEFKRIEGFWIKLTGGTAIPEGASIRYNVHIENEGWLNNPDNLTDTSKWKANGEFAGSTAKSQRIEAIEIVLVGADGKPLPGYSVKYLVHGENYGWTQGWKADGAIAGTTGERLRLEAIQIKIEQVAATAYDKAGTYGPKTGTEVVNNNVTVDADGVTLQNLHIKGDLTISEKVGNGTVNLNNVTVDGQTYVRGGGEHSIHINGGSYNNIVVEKTASGNVRIVATDATGAAVVISEDAKGQDIILEGAFDSVDIKAPDVKVSTQGDTKIGEMNVTSEATGSEITLDKKTTVDQLAVNAPVEMKGEGTVQKADVNSNGVTFEQKPVSQDVAPEVTEPPVVTPPAPVTPVTPPSSGGGGETTTTPVSAVEVINEGNVLSARIAPAAATVSYQWQRCDTATGTFTDIAGATTSTYTRGAVDGGKFIKVKATGTGSYSSSVTSLAMTPVSIVTRDPDNIGGTGANFDATTNSFTGSIDYYSADSKLGGTDGNRVGVKIKAPAGVNVDASKATVAYVNGSGGRTPLALNGPDYVYFYPQVTMAGQKYTCFIDWDGSGTTYGTEIVSVYVELGSTLKPAANVPVTIAAVKAAGATGNTATTTVKYSLDSAADAAITGTSYTAPVNVPIGKTIYFFAETVDGGTNSSGKTFVVAGNYTALTENSSGYTVNIAGDHYMASAAAPTFSIAAGAVELGSTVTLTAADGEHIFYTTDGTDPVYWMVTDSNSQITTPTPQGTTKEYTTAITIDKAMTIKAVAMKENGPDSQIVSAMYTLTSTSQALAAFAPTITATPSAQALSVAVSYPGTVAASIKDYTIDSQITIPDAFVGKELSFTISGISELVKYTPTSTTFSLADVNKMSPYQTTLDQNKGQSWTVSVAVPEGIPGGTYPVTIESLVKNGTGDPFVITKTNTTVTV